MNFAQLRSLLPAALFAALSAAPSAAGAAAGSRPAAPPAATVSGVVTRIIDGDTLLVQPGGRAPIEVRLRDIDAPESCQPWGAEAKQALEEMALGKTAELRTHARDAYGRTVATVTVDGQNLGKRMVEEGHAWSVRGKWDTGPLVKQERQAKALGRGLHAAPGAVPPKAFRATHGACPRH